MSDKQLKILSICTSDTQGGAARAAKRIHDGVNYISDDVQSVMFVKYKGSNDITVHSIDEFIPQNVFYKIFNFIALKIKNKVQHYRWSRYPNRDNVYMSDMRGTSVHGALHKLNYDVLHLHWINQRFIKLEDLKNIHKPIVWTLHDSWSFCGVCHYFFDCNGYEYQCGNCPFLNSNNKNDLSHKVWKQKYNIYKKLNINIVAPSKWIGDCAKQSTLLGQFPITVIPNCLDTDLFRPLSYNEFSPCWRKFLEKRFEKHFVLYGAMNAATDKRKGLSNLLSALQILENQKKTDFELIVFGADKKNLKFDVSIPIHFVGTITNNAQLVELYNIADVMVVPSLTEVFGQTASESLSCGTPVVAFRCTGIQDVVEHKKCGYLAEPYNDEDLSNGISWVLENNNNDNLSKNARAKVMDNYSVKIVSEKYVELYKKSIKK